MISGVWSPDKKNGFALNEKTMDGTEQERILTGYMRNPANHRERQRQKLKTRKYILGVIEQYPNLYCLGY
jgi:hypothetical protein